MCGISGLYSINGLSQNEQSAFFESSKVSHINRGPDDFGQYTSNDSKVVLTHSRLSLVDLSHNGHQPMKKHGLVLVFNGEVYNFRAIRAELEADGYTFFSQSDTEVILSAYDKWGDDCFRRFNGPLATALYNEETGELLLARDRVGEKPLYYFIDADDTLVYFGSTMKQIMKAANNTWQLNEDRIIADLIFNFWSDKEHTHIDGIDNVPVASIVKIDTNTGSRVVEKYWELSANETHNDEETIIRDVDELLMDAVDMRVKLDAPLGAILSGGIDSTLLVSMTKNALPYAPTCFTLSRKDHMDDDLFYATKYCDEHGLPHVKVALNDVDLNQEAFINATREMEEPSLDQVYLYISRNYETARQSGLKAVLNGQGADEIFLGYLDFYSFLRDEANYSDRQAFEDYWFNQSPLKESLDAERVKRIVKENVEKNYVPVASKDVLNSVLRFGVKTHLQSLLAQEDKQSMRWSVECRTAFTDYRLVEYMSAVPSRIKMLDDKEKYVLRQVAKKHLPDYIINRKKLGFPDLPDNREALIISMIDDGLLKKSPLLNRILSHKVIEYPNDLPLYMKWKLCSVAILERSIL